MLELKSVNDQNWNWQELEEFAPRERSLMVVLMNARLKEKMEKLKAQKQGK